MQSSLCVIHLHLPNSIIFTCSHHYMSSTFNCHTVSIIFTCGHHYMSSTFTCNTASSSHAVITICHPPSPAKQHLLHMQSSLYVVRIHCYTVSIIFTCSHHYMSSVFNCYTVSIIFTCSHHCMSSTFTCYTVSIVFTCSHHYMSSAFTCYTVGIIFTCSYHYINYIQWPEHQLCSDWQCMYNCHCNHHQLYSNWL